MSRSNFKTDTINRISNGISNFYPLITSYFDDVLMNNITNKDSNKDIVKIINNANLIELNEGFDDEILNEMQIYA